MPHEVNCLSCKSVYLQYALIVRVATQMAVSCATISKKPMACQLSATDD